MANQQGSMSVAQGITLVGQLLGKDDYTNRGN